MKKSISLVLAIIMLFSVVNVSVFAASIATPKVKATNTLSGVSVTWNKVSGAAKYVVYKRLGTESNWSIIATTTATSYEDKGTLKAGNYYVYSVKAYNSAGAPSDYIKANCSTVQRVIAPYTKAANALEGINVTWGKVAGATKYVVFRRIGTESTWKTLCTTTGTSFVDKNIKAGIYYVYSIRAVNGTGYSAYDVNKRITVQRVVAPYTKAANAIDGINITWGKVTGANKYVVLRRIGTESTWKTLCTTTGTSFLDKNVTPGIYYIYSIRAVNGTGYSAYDVNKRITVQRILTPTAKAVNKSNGVQVSWNSVTSATKYSVYRRLGGTSNWVLVGTTTGTTLLDKNVANGNYYAYSVRAINGTGYSAYDSGKTVAIKATKVRATFSSELGAVNGTVYTARHIGYIEDHYGYVKASKSKIPVLPVYKPNNNLCIASFCYYDGYIYYTLSQDMSGGYDVWLYRCNPDFTNTKLLAFSDGSDENSENDFDRYFYIYENKLYLGWRRSSESICINLSTLKKTKEKSVDFYSMYNVDKYGQIEIYNDNVFYSDEYDGEANIYLIKNSKKQLVAQDADLDGGYVNGWLYYSTYHFYDGSGEVGKLWRKNLSTGKTEHVDTKPAGGGGGLYFNW